MRHQARQGGLVYRLRSAQTVLSGRRKDELVNTKVGPRGCTGSAPMRHVFCHRRRPQRPFEDSDLAVAQFVFLTAALRLWHALDDDDERSLTRALTRFDRTAASYVDALEKAREKARKR